MRLNPAALGKVWERLLLLLDSEAVKIDRKVWRERTSERERAVDDMQQRALGQTQTQPAALWPCGLWSPGHPPM